MAMLMAQMHVMACILELTNMSVRSKSIDSGTGWGAAYTGRNELDPVTFEV